VFKLVPVWVGEEKIFLVADAVSESTSFRLGALSINYRLLDSFDALIDFLCTFA